MKKTLFLIFSLIFVNLFFSCVSTDVSAPSNSRNQSMPYGGYSEIKEFEREFARIDGEMLIEKNASLLSSCESLCDSIENFLRDPSLQNVVRARLYALEGMGQLLLGKKTLAKSLYDRCESLFKGEVFSLILYSRLSGEKSVLENGDDPLLVLEEALVSYRENDFASSVARFDEAFVKLDSFYRLSYSKARDNAWKLRDFSSGDDVLKAKDSITVFEMVSLAKTESSLLDYYAFGKNLSDADMYKNVSENALLDCVSLPPDYTNSVSKFDAATKIICARFLWNLYCGRKSSAKKSATKYSSAFVSSGRDSPILDVRTDSPDFDAVMACVEKEILNLEDGVHFEPEKAVSAIEFINALKKIR